MCRVMTSNYKNCTSENGISISGDRGKSVNFDGKYMSKLAPKKSFWEKWKNNIQNLSEEERTRFYIREYYKEVLSKIDPFELLDEIDDDAVLLCYEDNLEFCHRHLVAFYLELFLDIKTYEVKINSKRQTYHIMKRPEYLKEELENIIKEEYNMYGYSSIKAAYIYNKALKLKEMTKKEIIDCLKIRADIEERKYVLSKKKLID